MLKYTVDVTPNAAKTEVLKHNDVLLRVKVAAPAKEGKGNKALIAVLSGYFGVPKSKVLLMSGINRKRTIIGVIAD